MTTLQKLLKEVDRELLVNSTVSHHIDCSFDASRITNSEIVDLKLAYGSVYDKLVSFSEWKLWRSKYSVEARYDTFGFDTDDDVPSINISLLNLDYVEPPKDLKRWGGNGDDPDDAPEGYYNINYSDYNKYFSIDFIPWRISVNLEFETHETAKDVDTLDILSSYLYEITFNGFQERSYVDMKRTFKQRMDELDSVSYEDAMKELNDYAEDRTPVEPQTEGAMKIKFSKGAIDDLKKMIDTVE